MRGWLLAALAALACQKPTQAPPPSEPAPELPPPAPTPAPTPASAPALEPAADAGAVAEASPDAALPSVPACTPVARAPTIDVHLRFSMGRANLGPSMPAIASLVAKVSAPSVKLNHEIWSSPAPTSCSARAEGDEMWVSCITDEGQLQGRVYVAGEELVVEAAHGVPLLPSPVGASPAGAEKLRFERQTSVKVPCGARLRVHPASRDYR